MAYRTDISTSDRGRAVALVIAIHAALLFAFLHLSGRIDLKDPQQAMQLFDLTKPPPLPPRPKVQQKATVKEGGAAPKNIRSHATEVAAPKPIIPTPPVQQIAATETPRQGTEATQGAAEVRGPGTGAGGQGNGTGSGSGGNGEGSGGYEVAEPPHLVTPVLSGRDFPPDLVDQWPRRGTIFLRLRVDARGYVAECNVDRGTGVTEIDSMMCNLAHERLRFRPALNRTGQAVAGWFGYAQPAPQ